MGTLAQAKTYGGVGSILLLVSPFVPLAGIVVFIVGIILILLAVNYISDVLQDRAIWNNMLIFVVLAIVGFAVLTFFVFATVFSFIGLPGAGFEIGQPPDITGGDLIALFVGIILGAVIAWVMYLVGAVFMKRSYDAIANRLGVSMFSTTALIFLIGAVLLVIAIGALLIFVAGILQIVAFFSIPDQPQPAMAAAPPSP